jgi:pimeloyl-ACP methyl ester carboxylesterase
MLASQKIALMNKSYQFALAAAALIGLAAAPGARAGEQRPGLQPCRLPGVEHQAWCGSIKRPLDPGQAQGVQIDVQFALLPALARNRKPDPVFYFAGGPGQSAMDLAGPVGRMLQRLGNRRDLVFIDQRGTGRSAPLRCADELPAQPLADSAGANAVVARMGACRKQLEKLPHGDLRHYATWMAVRDADAVRVALGVEVVNLIGGSYGTRAVLEYMRQFPGAVRRAVIDGVAPPDMVLPTSFSTDNQAALDAALDACEGDARCRGRYPTLRTDWKGLLAGLPKAVDVAHPVTGSIERVTFTRDSVLGMTRAPLYVPALAAALPLAITEAARGRFEPLLGLSVATAGNSRVGAIAEGMHFSVVCSEDGPQPGRTRGAPGPDYGDAFARLYARICADWPKGEVPGAFYEIPVARSATLVLSGGADPATPPRHAERVALALGGRARQVVVPQAGHGLLGIACLRDAVFRFVDAVDDDQALKVDADCARLMPRPPAFIPVSARPPLEAAK